MITQIYLCTIAAACLVAGLAMLLASLPRGRGLLARLIFRAVEGRRPDVTEHERLTRAAVVRPHRELMAGRPTVDLDRDWPLSEDERTMWAESRPGERITVLDAAARLAEIRARKSGRCEVCGFAPPADAPIVESEGRRLCSWCAASAPTGFAEGYASGLTEGEARGYGSGKADGERIGHARATMQFESRG